VPGKGDIRVSVNLCNGEQCFCHEIEALRRVSVSIPLNYLNR